MDDSQHQQQQQHHHEKIKLVEINSYLTCYLCKGYLIDATTISECLHSFCRSCIIKFLQENCYCPVCEVIINKAKPCLKLDKTLQDIVYKLVPELFTKEMHRRKQFYQFRPALAPKVSPEERGEDTERTIFNPQDAISLSIEYVSDDSTPGAIPSLPTATATPFPNLTNVINNNSINNKNNKTTSSSKNISDDEHSNNLNHQHHHNNNSNFNNNHNNNKNKNNTSSSSANNSENINNNYISDNPMKRYLQCPGMCRIEVLKKFVRNKYNVDTSLFHIDILYKRVPLPDHYTLIDIGYIYSWKRNEPMKFFFRITDINKVSERFDYFDARSISTGDQKQAQSTPLKQHNYQHQQTPVKQIKSSSSMVTTTVKKTSQHQKHHISDSGGTKKVLVKNVTDDDVKVTKTSNSLNNLVKNNNNNINNASTNTNSKKRGISDECDENLPKKINTITGQRDDDNDGVKKTSDKNSGSGGSTAKSSPSPVYTNITLKRSDNLEIVTKIQKVSPNTNNNQSDKKPENKNNKKVLLMSEKKSDSCQDNNNVSKTIESVVINTTSSSSSSCEEDLDSKSKFFKSIELTAKSSISPVSSNTNTPKPPPPSSSSSSGEVLASQKRKNSSPIKAPALLVAKKARLSSSSSSSSKTPMRIVIQPKSMQNAAVRQIVTNLNQNVNSMTKIVEQTTSESPSSGGGAASTPSLPTSSKQNDLQSLIDNCKINIPSSLSITLNESNGDGVTRTPHPSIPPVKNFIEILKLNSENNKVVVPPPTSSPPLNSSNGTTVTSASKLQSFQKIFEESLAKKKEKRISGRESDLKQNQSSSNNNNNNNKRSILEIALQLQKKTKIEAENKSKMASGGGDGSEKSNNKLSPSQSSKSPPASKNNAASLHSTSLGLNYTVSVEAENKNSIVSTGRTNNNLSKSISSVGSLLEEKKSSPQQQKDQKKVMSPRLSPRPTNNRLIKPKVKSGLLSGGGVVLKKSSSSDLSSSQLLEKYNIQNLAQLTASFQGTLPAGASSPSSASVLNNGGGGGAGAASPGSGGGFSSALQHAMFLKHIEHQNWLNLNQGSLMQYEKYLQNLNAAQSKIMGSKNAIIKEN